MTAVADQSLAPEVRSSYAIYPELFDRYDLGFNCQAVLDRTEGLMLRASVSRQARRGPLEADDLRVFDHLLPYVRAAARQELIAERREVEVLLQASAATGTADFLLNRSGVLIGASGAAEQELRLAEVFLAGGAGLKAADWISDRKLQRALATALAPWRGGLFPGVQALTISSRRGEPITLRISTFPVRPFALGGEPAVLVTAHREASGPTSLRDRFPLTSAEAEVASLMARGATAAQAAKARGVTVETVRAQVKTLYRKLGVATRGALVAKLRG
jgi:DNA-binding CsgD family transcriptional regulator